jgi:major membrane immunogen (membrane-anchored lipoprotein)
MKKRSIGLMVMLAIGCSLILAAGSYAGTKMPTEIKLEKEGFKTKKSVVTFNHQKHVADYKIACGDCHHDDKGQPRTDLKEGDEVKSCFDCHTKPGELKGKKAKGLTKAEKLAYIGNAFHENCIGCHRAYDKKNKTKAAPTKCTECHPRKKK